MKIRSLVILVATLAWIACSKSDDNRADDKGAVENGTVEIPAAAPEADKPPAPPVAGTLDDKTPDDPPAPSGDTANTKTPGKKTVEAKAKTKTKTKTKAAGNDDGADKDDDGAGAKDDDEGGW